VSETPTDHEHDLVWVTSPDMEQARQYCRECGYRSEWVDLPPELQPQAIDMASAGWDDELDGGNR
jgi:hypothetical protein